MPYGEVCLNFGGNGSHDHGWTGTAATISRIQPYVTVYM